MGNPIRSRVLFWTATVSFGVIAAVATGAVTPTPTKDKALQVADLLDSVIQPRFQDDRGTVFGIRRVIPAVRGHDSVAFFDPQPPLQAQSEAEKPLFAQIEASHRDFEIAFLHCQGPETIILSQNTQAKAAPKRIKMPPSVSLLTRSLSGQNDAWQRMTPPDRKKLLQRWDHDERLIEQAALADLPRLMQGQSGQTAVGPWLVVTRPVQALKNSCLSCHTQAKKGDTLGAMVYAVRR